MQYSCHNLSAVRVHFRAFERLQVILPPAVFLSYLHRLATRGAAVVIARKGREIVGSLMSVPALSMPGIVNMPGLLEAAKDHRIDPECLLLRANIYVLAECRGAGVSVGLLREGNASSRAAGFTHSIGALYETPDIASWALRRKDKIETGLFDEKGYPVVFLPLG